MSGMAIFLEGGGTGRETKAALRRGMDLFLAALKADVREKSWKWKLVCCGSRSQAFRAYRQEQKSDDYSVVVLLVDSEGPIDKEINQYLNDRDGWDVGALEKDFIHLMTQTMETWIVADVNALANYYGENFEGNLLPKSRNLEEVSKLDVAKSLDKATKRTRKGPYHKIRHGSDLLKVVDPGVVRRRCPHCERMFSLLWRIVGSG